MPLVLSRLSLHDALPIFADPARGWAWQVPLLEMPQAQFVLMSATLGDTSDICRTMEDTTGRDSSVVTSATTDESRPVVRSEEHTSELQSRGHLVCRLLLE